MKTLGLWALVLVLLASALSVQAQTKPTTPDLPTLIKTTIHFVQKLADVVTLPTCGDLNHDNLQASDLTEAVQDGAVYCREIAGNGTYIINPGAIGDQFVIDQGVVQAYNVFGMTTEGVSVKGFAHPITVCLQGHGEVLLIPAFAAPHFVEMPPSYSSGDFTCAAFTSPGIVALVNEGE